MSSFPTILIAFVGGFLPALFWLWFWLREDNKHPEPKRLIALSFFFGVLAVPLAIPFEKMVDEFTVAPMLVLIGWAFVEEVLKYIAAWAGGMHTQAENEPIDAMVYLVTAAIGFAAAENAIFLIQPLAQGDTFTTLVTGNVRFIGTTLLHVLSSATIGASVAFSFYKRKRVRIEHLLIGLVLATALHTLFNFFIINSGQHWMFTIFAVLWFAIVILLLIFERVKRITRAKR